MTRVARQGGTSGRAVKWAERMRGSMRRPHKTTRFAQVRCRLECVREEKETTGQMNKSEGKLSSEVSQVDVGSMGCQSGLPNADDEVSSSWCCLIELTVLFRLNSLGMRHSYLERGLDAINGWVPYSPWLGSSHSKSSSHALHI